MRTVRAITAALLATLVVAGVATSVGDAETGHPPHVERPTAGVTGPLPLSASGADWPGQTITDFAAFLEAQHARSDQEIVGLAAAGPVAAGRLVPGGSEACAGLASELGLPESVLWRESRCRWDAYNPSGCGGRGCLGPAQVDRGHFADVSPWNSNTSGSCAGLDPDDPADYAECVSRLPASAWG